MKKYFRYKHLFNILFLNHIISVIGIVIHIYGTLKYKKVNATQEIIKHTIL